MRTVQQPLPGVGTLHLLHAADGHHVGIVQHADDRRELVVYDPADPDTRMTGVLLDPAEARVLADVLGVRGPTVHCARLDRYADRVAVLQVLIGAGRPSADTGVTGAVVAAVVRDDEVLVALPGQFQFRPGDVVVVVGRPDAALEVIDILTAA
ncbi:TrkA C-terminal domain-containing protein [Dactylosporangium sp. AC04546]|uniref:TrkA C-terminal domain-containing protein n=1 Tax=Dactylosporangium sp. AC04546 TaxID=2862460 RepID=UPI001EDDE581|nr:TrkA C-terminal domain-containing protein [Dactylosporangium sp. AC04546]WVK79191.1 TrkA C-terminal domain-containing protein [Dactylosporangium sp. AC04546]